ncbi:ATP-dependent DNA helicase [Aphis craccivora]|uniref:ATP-dependent DNA helicase n=1 Tax=Aphis craccivora TaxID=307492 RepID=A0A6G0ZC61_APHCR|nr:ATP-dependent DNA helicase [Aphis craccivora]
MNSPVRNENASDPFEFSILRSYDNNRLQEFVEINLPKLRNESSRKSLFFLDAPGGTGKTFLMNLLLAQIRCSGKVALAVASSGIAATLLIGGRTAHSTFKLPLNVLYDTECVCPILIPKGTQTDVVNACLKSSLIWNYVEKLYLRTNMRVYLCGGDDIFSALFKIGNGTLEIEKPCNHFCQSHDWTGESVMNHQGRVFFLDAPGGTGKTFLINLLLAQIRSSGKVALAVASSEYVCLIRKNGPLEKILQETSFVVWNEYTMSHRSHITAIDRTLKDLRCNNKFMGGITFVFADHGRSCDGSAIYYIF